MNSGQYATLYRQSIEDPESFWAKIAEDIHWNRRWNRVLDDQHKPFYRWFAGGSLNTCLQCRGSSCGKRTGGAMRSHL